MRLSSLAYFADFGITAALIVALAGIAAPWATWLQAGQWALWVGLGAVGWTLIEYGVHRWIYHSVPYFREMHDAHHAEPDAHIGAPPVIGAALILAVCFVPLLSTSIVLASGITTGVLTGYLAYMAVHHAGHHWTLPPAFWLAQAGQHHALHHYASGEHNFGITTVFWDVAFGTQITTLDKVLARRLP